ncbi:MAG: DUF2924 domain-containing protein [Planctomycetota bacterium]
MNPPRSIDDLKRLSLTELSQRWQQTSRGKPPPKVKLLLRRDLAWQAQGGGIDAATQTMLKSAIRGAQAPSERANPRKSQKPRTPTKPVLQSGAKLIRKWKGKTYEVVVIEPGKRFEFRDREYRNLTQIARQITGAHWSGPRFFGLNRMRGIQ